MKPAPPGFTFLEKINNRLLRVNLYLLGKSRKQVKLKEVIKANNNIFENIHNFQTANDYCYFVGLNIALLGDIDCVIDVGANYGQFAEQILQSGFRNKIISFEPQKEVFEKLKQKAKAFDNWDVYQFGVSTETGTKNLNIYQGNQFSSFHEPLDGVPVSHTDKLELNKTQATELVRLDEFFEHKYPKFIARQNKMLLKTDTQGHDKEVIKSCTTILGQIEVITTELSVVPIYDSVPDWTEMVMFLRERGFIPMGLFSINNGAKNFGSIEMDGIFVRA